MHLQRHREGRRIRAVLLQCKTDEEELKVLSQVNWDNMSCDHFLPCTDNEKRKKKCVTEMELRQRKQATPFWALSKAAIGKWAALPGHPTEPVREHGQC